MKIGILGSGNVGKALAKGFKAEAHEVMVASRDPKGKSAELQKELPGVGVGSFAEVATFAELAVICTTGEAAEDALQQAGPANLVGKVLIDVTNPIEHAQGALRLFAGRTDSLGERIQRLIPEAKVVKTLNSIGSHLMYKPQLSTPPTMFLCGNDPEAKSQVTGVLHSFGWQDVMDCGDITGARELEPLAMLWIKYGMTNNNWHHAFRHVVE